MDLILVQIILWGFQCVCVCVCICEWVSEWVCVCMCVRVCFRTNTISLLASPCGRKQPRGPLRRFPVQRNLSTSPISFAATVPSAASAEAGHNTPPVGPAVCNVFFACVCRCVSLCAFINLLQSTCSHAHRFPLSNYVSRAGVCHRYAYVAKCLCFLCFLICVCKYILLADVDMHWSQRCRRYLGQKCFRHDRGSRGSRAMLSHHPLKSALTNRQLKFVEDIWITFLLVVQSSATLQQIWPSKLGWWWWL